MIVRSALAVAVVVGAIAATSAAPTSSPEDDVEEVVRRVLQGISEGRVDLLEAAMYEEALLVSVRADGSVRTTSRAQFIEQVGGSGGELLERMWDPTVLVDGAVAIVSTPYDFWIGTEFSHCGVDTFQLVRAVDGWKVTSLNYDVRPPESCPESPLGDPKFDERGMGDMTAP